MPKNFSIRNVLTTEQLAILGEIAQASAQLEASLGTQIMIVLKFTVLDEEAIVAPMTLATRLEVLKAVGIQRIESKKKLKEFEELMNHLKNCVKQRNDAIHGLWGPEGDLPLGDLMAVLAGFEKAKAVEAKNKKRIFKGNRLEALAKDLDEGPSKIWAIAKATWLKPQLKERKVKKPVGGALATIDGR